VPSGLHHERSGRCDKFCAAVHPCLRRTLLRLRVQKERVTDDEEEGNICDAQEVKKEETKRSIRWSIAAAVFDRKTGLYGGGIFSAGEKRGILGRANLKKLRERVGN